MGGTSGDAGVPSGGAPQAGSPAGGFGGMGGTGVLSLPVPCKAIDLPGEPCAGGRCYGARCGIPVQLECAEGIWEARNPDQTGGSTAWDFVCPAEDEPVYDISEIARGQCCTAPGQGADLPPSQGCNFCPDVVPSDQASCALPADCDRIVDCFYSCCCYGTRTWAQCDGQRWHVTTNCSGK